MSLASADQTKEAAVLANYFQNDLIKAFSEKLPPDLKVVDAPGKESLIIELALVEVIPTKAWLNTIGYIAVGAVDHGVTAYEGRMRNGVGGAVIAQFKDREFGKTSLFNVEDLTWYGHSKDTIDSWSDEIVAIVHAAPGTEVSPMSTVTLRPW